jgi:hypothetical protein
MVRGRVRGEVWARRWGRRVADGAHASVFYHVVVGSLNCLAGTIVVSRVVKQPLVSQLC